MRSKRRTDLPRGRALLLFWGILIFSLAACGLGGTVQPTPAPPPSTSTLEPLPSPTVVANGSTLTAGPSCTVLQDLNLRVGPGTAYTPPIMALQTGTQLLPTGFNQQGVPGGPWVQVDVVGTDQSGWVSAGTQFVSCGLVLSSLPPVDVPPPPKPPAPRIGSGDVDGNNISSFRYALDYNPDYFVRPYVFRSDDFDEAFSPEKDGRGITSVEFTVSSPEGDVVFYNRTENNPGYCIFGGGEPECNAWLLEGDEYKWTASGEPVEPGNYLLTIDVVAGDGEVGTWLLPVYIALP